MKPPERARVLTTADLRQTQDLALAQQVAHRLTRFLGVAPALEFALVAIHVRLAREEVHGGRQIHHPEVQFDIDDLPAGAPHLIVEAHQAHRRIGEEALLFHELLAVESPALDEDVAAVREMGDAPRQGGCEVRADQLQVVAGLCLVNAGGGERGPRVTAQGQSKVGAGREPKRSRDDGVVGDEIVEERLDERLGSVHLCVTRMEAAWLRTSLTSVRLWDTGDRLGSTPRAPTPRWPGNRPFAGPERPQARVPQAHDCTRAPEAVQDDGARAAHAVYCG